MDTEASDPEFRIRYGVDTVIYMTVTELLADIIGGGVDLV